MNYIESKDAVNNTTVNICYNDYGKGKPVILIHGWPLSKEMWEYQIEELVNAGNRVVTYDRRGFGQSDKPWSSYDYNTLAADLKALIDALHLEDITLVGFSMGGGEVARYITNYGTAHISKIVLISSILPYLPEATDNKEGMPQHARDEMMDALKEDRIGFLENFGKQFFGVNLVNHPVSAPLLNYYQMLCSLASPRATTECMKSFGLTDFRNDVIELKLPTLIIHGDDDKIVPIEISSKRTAELIFNRQYVVYNGAPHGLFYTHKERLNKDLISFISTGNAEVPIMDPLFPINTAIPV